MSINIFFQSIQSLFKYPGIPKMPQNTDSLIEAIAKEQEWPNWHLGRLDWAESEELRIHFESIGHEEHPSILLIMGYGTTGLAWNKELIEPLVEAGYHVIRYDNRDVGRTRWKEGKEPQDYRLADMAKDACQILDKLGKEKAHIVGISMGGMIGQELAIQFPHRVETLTCLASTGYYFDPKLLSVSGRVLLENAKLILKYGAEPKNFADEVKKRIGIVSFLRNDPIIDEEIVRFTAQRILFKKEHDYINHPKSYRRHGRAIRKSGSRLEHLKALQAPVLLIHGKKDVLIDHAHSEKYAQLIPRKKEVYIEDMGHIPRAEDDPRIAAEIIRFIAELD